MQYSELESTSLVKIIKWVRKELKKDDKKKDSTNKPEQHPLLSKAIDLLDGEIM